MGKLVILSLVAVVLIGCGKTTKVEAHKMPSQLQVSNKTTNSPIQEKEISSPTDSMTSSTNIESETELIIDNAVLNNVESALKNVPIKSFLLAKMLTNESWAQAQKFSFDMIKSGINFRGPNDPTQKIQNNPASNTLYQFKNKLYYYVEFKKADVIHPLAFLFHIEQVEPTVVVNHIDVFVLVKSKPGTVDIPQFLMDKDSVIYWSKLGTQPSPTSTAAD